MRIAKDPIDFIRHFQFNRFVHPENQTSGLPVRIEQDLYIHIHPINPGEDDGIAIHIPHGNVDVLHAVADYLEARTDLGIFPFANVEDANNWVLWLTVSNSAIDLDVLLDTLTALIAHIEQAQDNVQKLGWEMMYPSAVWRAFDPRKLSDEKKDIITQAKQMFDEGRTKSGIARALGVSRPTVDRYLNM